jgi:hypothetical protein
MQKSKYHAKNLEFGQTECLGFRHLTFTNVPICYCVIMFQVAICLRLIFSKTY